MVGMYCSLMVAWARNFNGAACGAGLSLLYDGAECLSDAKKILIVVCGGIGVDVDQLNDWAAQTRARA